MKYIYLCICLVCLLSCSYENKTIKEEFEFENANLHLDTTIVSTIKTYIRERPNPHVVGLYCKSMPGRNNIVLLTASRFGNILDYKPIPTSYFKIDGIPVLLYYGRLKLDMGQDSLRYTQFIKVYSKKLPTDIALYDPPCWILMLSKDKIHVYKSIEEYERKVGFYEPTVHFW